MADIPYGVGILVVKDGRILCGKRSDNGMICGPGGHIKAGETPRLAALREAEEEFGIRPVKLTTIGALSNSRGKYRPSMVFLCTEYTGDVKSQDGEMVSAYWASLDELHRAESKLFPVFADSLELLEGRMGMRLDAGGNPYHDPKNGRFTSKNGGSASSGCVDGKDITESYSGDGSITDVLKAQGFDGKPRIVSQEEFDKAVQESNFIAQRTYSGTSQEVLDAYREQLYDGEFYVECSEGGAQYGKGMYCAADYSGNLSDGIKSEMDHYRSIGRDRTLEQGYDQAVADAYTQGKQIPTREEFEKSFTGGSYTETFTLDPSAKTANYDEISQAQKLEGMPGNFYAERIKGLNLTEQEEAIAVNTFQRDLYQTSAGKYSYEDLERFQDIYSSMDNMDVDSYAKIESSFWDKWGSTAEKELKEYQDRGRKLKKMDVGSYAALKGYDAINAEHHGQSGSYTVVLNRTKMILLDGRTQHDSEDDNIITFRPGKNGTYDAIRDGNVIGQVYTYDGQKSSRKDAASGNPYHDPKTGRFTSKNGGNAVSRESLIPKDSYTNTEEYKEISEEYSQAVNEHDAAYAKYKEKNEEAKKHSHLQEIEDDIPDDAEWDLFSDSKIRVFDEEGSKLHREAQGLYKKVDEASKVKSRCSDELDRLKYEAHEKEASERQFSTLESTSRTEFEGFDLDKGSNTWAEQTLKSGKGYIVEMSPREYFDRCALQIFPNGTYESAANGVDYDNVHKYAEQMRGGEKFPVPYLNYNDFEQEGRHRALAAIENGYDTIPVLVVGRQSENKHFVSEPESLSNRRLGLDPDYEMEDLDLFDFDGGRADGGKGSGNFGHAGRPGYRGGSSYGRIRTAEELIDATRHYEKIIKRYVKLDSMWSGNIIVDNMLNASGEAGRKEWECDITLTDMSGDDVIIHEYLHSMSESKYTPDIFAIHSKMEEASTQYLTELICQKNNIRIHKTNYEKEVEVLRNVCGTISKDPLWFASRMYEVPLDFRYNWLLIQAGRYCFANKTNAQEVVKLGKMLRELKGAYPT